MSSPEPSEHLNIYETDEDRTPLYEIPLTPAGDGRWRIKVDDLWPLLDELPHGSELILQLPISDTETALAQENTEPYVLENGDLKVWSDSPVIEVGTEQSVLTTLEHKLLLILLRRQGHVATREEISAELWPTSHFFDKLKNLSTEITSLRRKIGAGALGDVIKTVHGKGYRIPRHPEKN